MTPLMIAGALAALFLIGMIVLGLMAYMQAGRAGH